MKCSFLAGFQSVLFILSFLIAVFESVPCKADKPDREVAPVADITIRGKTDDGEIVITTTSRLSGAIHSLRYQGKEFIDSFDHGRQLQSASNFDFGSRITGETFNPTEAGSRSDGAAETSTSRLLHSVATENSLQTTSQMAFWLAPGQKSDENLAKNKTRLSNHLLTKRVTIGYGEMKNVIDYRVTFGIPVDEEHRHAVFEALTGYMPAEFSQFQAFVPSQLELIKLDDGPGEQKYPVIFSTEDERHAMGIFSPDQPSDGFAHVGYGRFRFAPQKVTKWNCVFRVHSKAPIPPGDFSYRCFVIVGDLEIVTQTMIKLHKQFAAAD